MAKQRDQEQTDLQKTPQKSEDCAIRISIKTGDPPELIRLQWYLLNTSGAGTTYPSGAPEFSWGSRYSIFSFMCIVLKIVVCPFVLLLLTIVLSVLLRFTDSEYPFGIFKLFH